MKCLIYSPTGNLLRPRGFINLNHDSSLMFQIQVWVHGLFVPELFRREADSCIDIINNTHIKVTSEKKCTQTHLTKTQKHGYAQQYVTACKPAVLQIEDPTELPVNSTSDILFSSYCTLVEVYLLNNPHPQMVLIDSVYRKMAVLQRCSISSGLLKTYVSMLWPVKTEMLNDG